MNEQNGRKIKMVTWPDSGDELGRCISTNEKCSIELCSTYHGDRDEVWVVVISKETGNEVERHNVKYIESIIWEQP